MIQEIVVSDKEDTKKTDTVICFNQDKPLTSDSTQPESYPKRVKPLNTQKIIEKSTKSGKKQ